MREIRAFRSPSQGYRRLGLQGESVIAAHLQISTILRSRCGVDCANFLARPKIDPETGDIDWYVNANAKVRELTELDAAGRELVERAADDCRARIRTLAEKLTQDLQAHLPPRQPELLGPTQLDA